MQAVEKMMSLVQNTTKISKNLQALLPPSSNSITSLKRESNIQNNEQNDSLLAPQPINKSSALKEKLRKMPSFNSSENENNRKKYNFGTLERNTKKSFTDDLINGTFFVKFFTN